MTGHRDIRALLSDHVLGELPDDTERVVRDHLVSCRECREWAHTARLAASTRPADGRAATGDHPLSEELAAYVVGEPALEFGRWQAVERHLAGCSLCAEEVSLCEEALGAGEPERHPQPAAHSSRTSPARRGAIAAAAALALLVSGFLALDRKSDPDRGRSLAGERLTGRRVIEVPGALAANRLRIEPGAHITLRAESVALGDGFSVGQDAELVIDGTPRRSR